MTRPVALQVYLSDTLAEQVRKAASDHDMSVSEWLRSIIADRCGEHDLATRHDTSITRILRMMVFARVGVDGLLAGHADPTLRDRIYKVYRRQCTAIGLPSPAAEGGRDEA
ncbi:hypothetical protein [Croceicoccus marinus]|uniref:Ribbon-helix-helix protein CopG domain-containing protein n=1 Tax=Croceicoccus marinus TaxID=450378 RepID=A0A1Z1F893_9SPHN|nr:hypothetical protein [Croceicoccus marinus]ARU14955.1 hypothetical protein A9D14_00680 [Croceicoccus marinus]